MVETVNSTEENREEVKKEGFFKKMGHFFDRLTQDDMDQEENTVEEKQEQQPAEEKTEPVSETKPVKPTFSTPVHETSTSRLKSPIISDRSDILPPNVSKVSPSSIPVSKPIAKEEVKPQPSDQFTAVQPKKEETKKLPNEYIRRPVISPIYGSYKPENCEESRMSSKPAEPRVNNAYVSKEVAPSYPKQTTSGYIPKPNPAYQPQNTTLLQPSETLKRPTMTENSAANMTVSDFLEPKKAARPAAPIYHPTPSFSGLNPSDEGTQDDGDTAEKSQISLF